MIKENRSSDLGVMQPKKGKSIRAVIAEVSKEYLDSPNDIKISRGAIERALHRGDEVSPLKPGRKVSVLHDLMFALATHSTMMQVAGDGEASASNMKAVASAVLAGTKYDGKIDVEYLWRVTRRDILKS